MSLKPTLDYQLHWLWPAIGRGALRQSLDVVPLSIRRQLVRSLKPDMRRSLAPFDKYRCIFVHIPKCSGLSISDSIFGVQPQGHTTLRTYQMILSPEEFRDYFKFTVVRNPWDRLVSVFFYLKAGGRTEEDKRFADEVLSSYDDFENFVRRWLSKVNIKSFFHFRPQCDWISVGKSGPGVDFIGRFENIEADFAYVCEKLNIKRYLPKLNINISRKRDYREYYTEETRQMVADIYAEDIQVLGYSFNDCTSAAVD